RGVARGLRRAPAWRAQTSRRPLERSDLRASRARNLDARVRAAAAVTAADQTNHLRLKDRGRPMCGIVGYVGRQSAAPILLEGLHQLEYRGYDSAGIALARRGRLAVHKRRGPVAELERVLPKRLSGQVGIGHTRWATHGEPSDANAHPHVSMDGRIAVIHNGIIENARDLKASLEAEGVAFASETDTEVLAHLIAAADAETLEERVRI